MQSEAQVRVVAIHEIAFVKDADLFTDTARHQERGPCDETTWAQFCGAAEMRYESGPEIDGAAAPGLYLAGVVHVVEDRANGSSAGDGQRLLHHFACGIGRRHCVIVEQPDIVG